MFCRRCGQRIDDNAVVCPYCQSPVRKNNSPDTNTYNQNTTVSQGNQRQPQIQPQVTSQRKNQYQQHVQQQHQIQKQPSKNNTAKKVIISVVAVLLVAAIVVGTLFFLKAKKEKEELEHRDAVTKILEKTVDKPIIETYFADYDNNGVTEAFALVGNNSTKNGDVIQYTDADIYFADEKKAQIIDEKVTGKTNGILTTGDISYISFENTKSKTDSGFSYIYGVKNGSPFESATSGIYRQVHQDGDKILGKKDLNDIFVQITISNETIQLKADYTTIIRQYEEVVKNRLNFDEAKETFGEYVSPLMINLLGLFRNYGDRGSENTARIYYSLIDINKDGINECIIGMGSESNISIFSIFTHDRRNAIALFDIGLLGERTNLKIYDNGNLRITGSNGADHTSYSYYNLPIKAYETELLENISCEEYQYYSIDKNGVKTPVSDEYFHDAQRKYEGYEIYLQWTEIRYNNEDPSIIPEPKAGDIIKFGSYPQTKVTDADIISGLNAKSANWISYGYYSATDDEGKTEENNFMYYTDILYDGERYRGVKFTDYRPAYTTLFPTAENSYQDDNGYKANTVYWFKYEPIKWRVLDTATGLVMCENIIDAQAFSNTIYFADDNYWSDINNSNPTNDYSNSSLRSWLNDSFYYTAFEEYERAEILRTTCDNTYAFSPDSSYPSTTDHVFIMSYNEMLNYNYGFSRSDATEDAARIAQGTDYAKCQGLLVNSEGNSWYPLRSALDNSRNIAAVSAEGNVTKTGAVDNTEGGIRPAIRLNELTLL